MDLIQPTNIFIAYSRKDQTVLEEIRSHLSPLERTWKTHLWYDGLIDAGSEWNAEIKQHLLQSDIILLLISQHFIASDYCYNTEMKQALNLHEKGTAKVIPIIVRNCLWKDSPFSHLPLLSIGEKAILGSDWPSPNTPFLQIAQALRAMVLERSDLYEDPRDKQLYPILQIRNGAVWLAQNLNFDIGTGSFYYQNDASNEVTYGRLYTWDAAQKACPPGWHLPSDEEWTQLANTIGGLHNQLPETPKKVKDQKYDSPPPEFSKDFVLAFGGYAYWDKAFFDLGNYGIYWSAKEWDTTQAIVYSRLKGKNILYREGFNKNWAASCRCVKD